MKVLLIFLWVFLFIACTTSRKERLEHVLKLAGENRSELEKVFEHFSNDQEKLASARFLIENMIGKSLLDSNSISINQPYFDALIEYRHKNVLYKDDIQRFICDSISKIYSNIRPVPKYIFDLNNISANYLKKHIEYSFSIRMNNKWARKIDFDVFCKYTLPYTTSNCYWKDANDYFYEKYRCMVDTTTSLASIVNLISTDIDRTFLADWTLFVQEHPDLLPTTFKNIALAQIGTCLEQNIYKIAAFRALGIPATLNLIPCWGNSNSPHFWTEIMQKEEKKILYDNKEKIFTSNKDILINNMFWLEKPISTYEGVPQYVSVRHTRTVPKVYRVNYELQKESLFFQAKEDIPPFFKNLGLEDITDQYLVCSDVDIPLWENPGKCQYVYLCCYDSQDWTVVDWAIAKKSEVVFKNVGVNILYLPAYYKNGVLTPAGNPFILDNKGIRKELHKTEKYFNRDVILYSKYPYRSKVMDMGIGMIGGNFLLANTTNFSDAVNVHQIEEVPYYENEFIINTMHAYRYLICNFNNKSVFSMSEIEVFSKNKDGVEMPVSGYLIGNAGVKAFGIKNLMDNDRVSYFCNDTTDLKQYIAIDFGKPIQLSRVRYYPRSDDNRVVSGELYELYYWGDRGWISLGKQVGKNNQLIYSKVPENVLLRLHNHTRGKEHRPFTYEDNKQLWW